jgi:hypothetical protein
MKDQTFVLKERIRERRANIRVGKKDYGGRKIPKKKNVMQINSRTDNVLGQEEFDYVDVDQINSTNNDS